MKHWIGLLLVLVLIAGCGSHKNKRLKPGKPIPCPQKDC
jgi:uncharacterized protein YcfL